MGKIFNIFLLITLFNSLAFGTCPKPVTYLLEGVKSPCNGYLFTPEKEKELREIMMNYDRLNELNKTQAELINVMDQRLALQAKINDNLREQNQLNEKMSLLEKALWFVAGSLFTGSIVYLTGK